MPYFSRRVVCINALMTLDIAIVLIILGISLVLFISEVIRMDLVALLVLGALA